MRPNEIGNLEVTDIVTLWAWPHFNVTTQRDIGDEDAEEAELSPEDGSGDTEKSVKTQAGKRLVPIHPELIRIGFMQYLEDVKAEKQRKLFPDWNADKFGYYSTILGKWFNRTFLTNLKLKKKKNCFYSLRHSVEDAFNNSGINETTRDLIMGHQRNDTQARYGSAHLLKGQSEEFRMHFRHDNLDLSHVQYERGDYLRGKRCRSDAALANPLTGGGSA
jgi:hypothetical protein